MDTPVESAPGQRKREEWRSFVFLAIVMAPLLSGLLIAGYGFLIWFTQLVMGPPGS